MKHIIKVETLENLPGTRPIIAMDNEGNLFIESLKEPELYIDLELPSGTLWANYNLGVDPTDLDAASKWYGGLYIWGDTNDTANNGKTANQKNDPLYNSYTKKYEKYTSSDGLVTLLSSDDAATKILGSSYRMPTNIEFTELLNNTTHVWVTNYQGIEGLNGYKFISNINSDKYLFFPAAGVKSNGEKNRFIAGQSGDYWSASRGENENGAGHMSFRGDFELPEFYYSVRFVALSIRPIYNPS